MTDTKRTESGEEMPEQIERNIDQFITRFGLRALMPRISALVYKLEETRKQESAAAADTKRTENVDEMTERIKGDDKLVAQFERTAFLARIGALDKLAEAKKQEAASVAGMPHPWSSLVLSPLFRILRCGSPVTGDVVWESDGSVGIALQDRCGKWPILERVVACKPYDAHPNNCSQVTLPPPWCNMTVPGGCCVEAFRETYPGDICWGGDGRVRVERRSSAWGTRMPILSVWESCSPSLPPELQGIVIPPGRSVGAMRVPVGGEFYVHSRTWMECAEARPILIVKA